MRYDFFMKRQLLIKLLLSLAVICGNSVSAAQTKSPMQVPPAKVLKKWVQGMKHSPKGPFIRIRWFCRDGTILPPEPYACKKHGGGRQHGEWSEHTKTLRAAGFLIANVLVTIDASKLPASPEGREELKQILLEQFMKAIDDGWIFRRARDYRGALQYEQETAAAHKILLALVNRKLRRKQDYLLLRNAASLLPHGQPVPLVTDIRQLSTRIAELDTDFAVIRNKIHTLPDAGDARRVRRYANKRGKSLFIVFYEQLAMRIDRLYKPSDIAEKLSVLSRRVKSRKLARRINRGAHILLSHLDPATRFSESANLLSYLRRRMSLAGNASRQLAVLDVSLELEREAFASGTALLKSVKYASRRQRLYWMKDAVNALYGSGLLSSRQWRDTRAAIRRLDRRAVSLSNYRRVLAYLSRVPSWANRWLQFQYGTAVEKLSGIEPKMQRFIPEQLRSSALLVYSVLLDSLMRDANRLAGIENRFFGATVGLGLRSLNPGIARGVLYVPGKGMNVEKLRPDGIYLLPATTEKLSRVAGILTLGEGNALSHVQILASNLGIPNVVVDRSLVAGIRSRAGRRIVLAVSPGGRVHLMMDSPKWDVVFKRPASNSDNEIRPDLARLRLDVTAFIPLGQLRRTDSGKLAGPKSTNLGELKHRFPRQVTDGFVIPFGVFRQLLNQKISTGGVTVFEWMKSRYRAFAAMEDKLARQKAVSAFLKKLRHWILTADAGKEFRQRLKQALQRNFGKDGSYSLFIRSDTNIEDLPGFTGAGLNLTVPNVSGFRKILQAIHRVWASPFTERAYAWRQKYMKQPEHVYSSVLLMRTVPVDKSGVLVTMDLETGSQRWLTVAVNEGIGGAVAGQAAEELRINRATGKTWILAEATSPLRRMPGSAGGLVTVPVSGAARVLKAGEIRQLLWLVRRLRKVFPIRDKSGKRVAADVEFGFRSGKLVLFQIRPFIRSKRAGRHQYLIRMDAGVNRKPPQKVRMDDVPGG
jgi:hypothetical protein